MNISYEQALTINNFIDRIHSAEYWAFPSMLGAFAMLEIFLPAKDFYLNQFDRYYTYLKFSFIIFLTLVATSQGFTGGCLVHLVQNWLAQNYLGKEYWNTPYGIVYRELVPEDYVWMLQMLYFLGGIITILAAWRYYQKFIRFTTMPDQKLVN